MIVEKKYFSISEVAEFTGLSTHKLRYVEKTDQNLSIIKMRGRRYYMKDSINYLKQNYSLDSTVDGCIPSEFDKVPSLREENSMIEDASYQAGLFCNVNTSDTCKTTVPQQLDLGIKSLDNNYLAGEGGRKGFHLNSIDKNTNQISESAAKIFTEIEFQQISTISRIDRLLKKLYKLVETPKDSQR